MAWEGVPWMVAGGQHSAEVGRLLAYSATAAGEGVIGAGDCKVVASAIPDGNIHINPGAVAMLNRFAGGAAQSYLARNVGDEVKAMTPQGSSGARYDLVCLVVQDPQYAGQPAPPSVPNGPYVITKVYEDVPATTISLAEVDPNQTGYALARVKFDASDGTVNQADITDLRDLLQPRVKTVKKVFNALGANQALPAALGNVVPTGADMAVDIPKWATKVQIEARWSGVVFTDTSSGAGYATGYARVDLGTIQSQTTQFRVDATASNKPVTQTIMVGDTKDVDAAMRGTSQTLAPRLAKTSGTGMTAEATAYTTCVIEATFYEALI